MLSGFSRVWFFVTPHCSHQAPLSMGFSRQEYWSGLSFPSPGDLSDLEIEHCIGRQVLYHWATWDAPYPSVSSLNVQFSSVQFSHSIVSNSLQPHESQHARPPCPSPTPRVHSDSCASSWWCHPAISSSVVPFSSCPQSLPASEAFPMSQLFTWGGQSTGVSALASFLPKNTQGWSPSERTGWISLQNLNVTVNLKLLYKIIFFWKNIFSFKVPLTQSILAYCIDS